MDSPVFEHEAQDEHQEPQGVIEHPGGDLFFAGFGPYPAEQHHGEAIDGPEGKYTPHRMVRGEFPCSFVGEGEEVACGEE